MEKSRKPNNHNNTVSISIKTLSFFIFLTLLSSCAVREIKEPLLHYTDHISLATIYYDKGYKQKAIAEYENAALAEPNTGYPYFVIGNIYLKDKEIKKAKDYYNKAIKREPKNASYLNNLAWVYIEENKLKKARKLVIKALLLDETKSYIYFDTLGEIEFKSGNYEDSLKRYKGALATAPKDDKNARLIILKNLKKVYEATGDKIKAEEIELEIMNIQLNNELEKAK